MIDEGPHLKKLLQDADSFYTPKGRPSGQDISARFADDNGGAIPSNLLQIPNTESNSQYLRYCKAAGVTGHPARFPARLPEFFVQFLTSPNDLVVVFAGSNTTGAVCEQLNRRWISFDLDQEYLAASVFRFVDLSEVEATALYGRLSSGTPADHQVLTALGRQQALIG